MICKISFRGEKVGNRIKRSNLIWLLLPVFIVLVFIILQIKYSRIGEKKFEIKTTKKKISYSELIKNIKYDKYQFNSLKIAKKKGKIKHYWMELLDKKLFPAWSGTLYSFYGTAKKPYPGILLTNLMIGNKKKIACGYFVAVILKDMGFNISRPNIGQMASGDIINTIVKKKSLRKWYSNISVDTFIKKIKLLGTGIYILGLDRHTGFILYDKTQISFIHASGYFPYCVIKEDVKDAKSIKNSKAKVIGKFSDDPACISRWLNYTRI